MSLPPNPLIVLDDDPTGTQTVEGVRVLLSWDPETLSREARGAPALHLLTNTRAVAPAEARRIVGDAARDARAALAAPRVVLRGDSTLRGHLIEEYDGVRDVLMPGREPALLLVPALPTAGRITLDGVQLIKRDGRLTPLHETEYARDGVFAYRDARLLQWAEDRSAGRFPRGEGRELALPELRRRGADLVADTLVELSRRGRPAACAPDVENEQDLQLVADGLARALAREAQVVVRCGPAFAGVLAGTTARGPALLPAASGGVLVICGSYVPATRRQLAALLERHPETLVVVDVAALASDSPAAEIRRAARAAADLLARDGVAIVATPRERSPDATGLEFGARVAAGLAHVLDGLDRAPEVIVAKGGITSAVVAHVGLRANAAEVVGPVAPGVALWRIRKRSGVTSLVVVPGNVGGDNLLAELVDGVLEARG